jgi:hypothetical protein
LIQREVFVSRAARSITVFGVYLAVTGLGFLAVPNFALGLSGLPETSEPYIRLVGMLALVLAYFYFRAARIELREFFWWTVHTRSAAVLLFIVFVLLEVAEPVVLLFGAADLVGAIWTYLTLRSAQAN